MNTRQLVGTAIAVTVFALAGCGSTHSQPAHSAAAACKDFAAYVAANAGQAIVGRDRSLLAKSVAEAPSGHLYADMSTVESDVKDHAGIPATTAALLTNSAVLQTEQDCQSVNPNS
jgi:hypothetical protein